MAVVGAARGDPGWHLYQILVALSRSYDPFPPQLSFLLMNRVHDDFEVDGVPVVRLESDWLKADIAPSVGGRVISLIGKGGEEFLWRNPGLTLQRLRSGSEYDPNFYGGIDELLPNDIPEIVDGVSCPDHGELWTTPLNWKVIGSRVTIRGSLPAFGLEYEREMSLRDDGPILELKYRLTNPTGAPRRFLWKLHAALSVQSGDLIECPAQKAQVVDPAWSRFKTLAPFDWPNIEGQAANLVPVKDGTMDFFYLFNLRAGEITLRSPARNLRFSYQFDTAVFPYAWVFASYGGFNGHYTVILEPCTAMPISVNDAATKGQCSRLEPGQSLKTSVSIFAGRAT